MRARLARYAYYLRALRKDLRRLDDLRMLEDRYPTVLIEDGVKVISPHLLELGERVNIQRNSLLHCGGLSWSAGRGSIKIGDGSSVGHNCVLWGAGEIEIGRNVHLGPGSFITSVQSPFEVDPADADKTHILRKITIEDDAAVFSCLIAPGVTVGESAVIAGMSLVTRDVPPMEMWGGVPARKIRDLDPEARTAVIRGGRRS